MKTDTDTDTNKQTATPQQRVAHIELAYVVRSPSQVRAEDDDELDALATDMQANGRERGEED